MIDHHQGTFTERAERRALFVSLVGNLAMGSTGIAVAVVANSQAVLVDGMLALIGAAAAVIALRVSRNVAREPDSKRPFGYGADESIFTTFRALRLSIFTQFAVIDGVSPVGASLSPALVVMSE